MINAWRNKEEAHNKHAVFVKSAGNLFGTTAPTQDMLLWPGIELVGCASSSSKIVNGVIYHVTEITEDKVTVKDQHEAKADREKYRLLRVTLVDAEVKVSRLLDVGVDRQLFLFTQSHL